MTKAFRMPPWFGRLFALSLVLLWGCEEKGPVYVGEAKPESFMLSFQQPETFEFELEQAGQYKFAFALTYFAEQMQNMNGEIPMYYILEGPGLDDGKDRKFSFPVKNEQGEWKGALMENDNDREFEAVFEENISLQAGKHIFKLYADSKNQGEPVQGVVQIDLKIYEN